MKYTRTKSGQLKPRPLVAPPRYKGYKPGDTVQIAFGITKCKFLTPYPQPLDRALTAPHAGYMFTPSFKAGHWDGHHHFITQVGYFPTGLLPVVMHILKTGNNPLINENKDDYIVLKTPVVKVEIISDKNATPFHYPGLENYYANQFDILEMLNDDGEFIFPTAPLKEWVSIKDSNPMSGRLLALAKSLHETP